MSNIIRTAVISVRASRYVWRGWQVLRQGKIEVPVLDGVAIATSMLRGDSKTAGSVMFLLGIGELLEEWTHKKSVGDLARSMSMNIEDVWIVAEGQEILVNASNVKVGDRVIVRMGSQIPFDGIVVQGEGLVNQALLTRESMPVRKSEDGYVYAGTVLEEGELVVEVREAGGRSKYDRIVEMIEESEKLKSSLEGKAEHLADKLVPYTLAGSGLVWLFTGNVTKALSLLMVDYSCALKLAMPIAVLSAIRELNSKRVVMIGDGINDSPALSAADVGIAVSEGAEIARMIADVTISGEDLYEIVTMKKVSDALMKRIDRNYRFIVGFNSGLMGLGMAGIITPATSAFLHNSSTLAVGLKSMDNLL